MQGWAVTQIGAPQGRRILDTAEGILIGLRGCDADTAFQELLRAAHAHEIPVFRIAAALVHLAADDDETTDISGDAKTAAQREWAALLAASPKMRRRNHR
jgi:putative intracellular protease/amidase